MLIQYDADVSGLSEITEDHFGSWQQTWKAKIIKPRYPLDILYELVPE